MHIRCNRCWDVQTRTKLWQIEPTHDHQFMFVFIHSARRMSSRWLFCSGFSALSPDQRFLLISNLTGGADLYRLGQSTVTQSYPQVPDEARNFPLAVAFMHNGEAVICGANHGDVSIRQTWSGEHQQTLEHGGTFRLILVWFRYISIY